MFFSTVLADSSSSELTVSITPNLALSVVDSNGVQNLVSVDITPNASGVFGKGSTNVIVSTTNETGYTLTMSGADDNTDLVHTNVSSATIPTLSSDVVEAEFPVNRYGYNFNNAVSGSTTDLLYSAIPSLSAPTTLATTSTNGSATYPFTIAAKADTAILSGTYQDTIVFSVTANYVPPAVYEFSYTGGEQEFVVPRDGTYKIELWGSNGGDYGGYRGGRGSYTSGSIDLNKDDKLFLYIGGAGLIASSGGGYNGGGVGARYANGGGSTDIRLVNGTWNNASGLRSRIMVAGSGGAAENRGDPYGAGHGGSAGGLSGYVGTTPYGGSGVPSTQTSGARNVSNWYSLTSYGYFGYSTAITHDGNSAHSGGGSGYWGGAACVHMGCSGGSSFISGHNGSIAIESADSLTPRKDSSGVQCTDGTTDILCSYHYSGLIFTNTTMIDGNGYNWTTAKGEQVQMPNPQGEYYPLGQGHTGNGYARITRL